MALDVTAEMEISKNAEAVAAYAFEPENDPIWIGGISEVKLLTGRPITEGTRVQRLAKFLGKTIDYILEVRKLEPGRFMLMKSIKSPFPMKVTYQFDPVAENITRAQIRVEGTARRHYGLFDFLMAPMIRRNLRGDLMRLKKIMEES